jgi:hypothetical protein
MIPFLFLISDSISLCLLVRTDSASRSHHQRGFSFVLRIPFRFLGGFNGKIEGRKVETEARWDDGTALKDRRPVASRKRDGSVHVLDPNDGL